MPDRVIEGMQQGSWVKPGSLTLLDDINAVRMHLYGSLLGPDASLFNGTDPRTHVAYQFQRNRGEFERPTFLIQSLNQAWTPGGSFAAEVDHNMLVEFYGLDYATSMLVANDLMLLFGAPANGVVLPYWDMTTDPENPSILMDDWWQRNAGFPAGTVRVLGPRVLPDTLAITSEQEENEVAGREEWTVSMTFRMLAPRILYDADDDAVTGKVIREVKLSGFVTGSSAGFVSA